MGISVVGGEASYGGLVLEVQHHTYKISALENLVLDCENHNVTIFFEGVRKNNSGCHKTTIFVFNG